MLFFFVSCGGGGSNDPVQDPSGSNPVPNPSDGIHEVTAIEMSQTSATIHLKEELKLLVKCSPAEVNSYKIDWVTSDEKVVDIRTKTDSCVTVIGKAAGTATIIAKVNGLSATCQVTVSDSPVDVESITLDKSEIELYEGQTASLLATIFPAYATNQTLMWTTENKDIATVVAAKNNWEIRALVCAGRPGTTDIIATSNNGKVMAKCHVTVKSNNKVNYNPYENDNQW